MNLRRGFLIFVIFILSLIVSCATPPRNEFSNFAQAGGVYAVAVDKLLIAAGSAQVDSTSWSMVAEKEDTGMDYATYEELNKSDLERLQAIQRLSQHAQLLGRYFGLLEALATSDAPQRTQNAIQGVIEGLESLNMQLPQGVAALPAIGELAVDFKIRKALEKELDERKETIRSELFIQEQLLKNLNKQIAHALKSQKQKQEEMLVVQPLVEQKNLTNPEKWVSTRHKIVYMTVTVQELSVASQAATKLREAFEGLLFGEVTIGRLNALLADIEALLAIAETIKQ